MLRTVRYNIILHINMLLVEWMNEWKIENVEHVYFMKTRQLNLSWYFKRFGFSDNWHSWEGLHNFSLTFQWKFRKQQINLQQKNI